MNDQDQTLSEFKRLLKEGRKIQFRASKKEEARKLLEQAAQYADDHGLSAEAGIARASIQEMEKKYDDALAIIEEALKNPDILLPGIAWHVKGAILQDKGDYDQAIESFQLAIDLKGYDTFGDAWFSIGTNFLFKQDYDQAIEFFRKAIALKGYDTKGDAWNNMGISYDKMQDYDQAIECFKKAIASSGFYAPEYAWNNMGFSYNNKQDYDQAKKCFKSAITLDNKYSQAYANLGYMLNKMGERKEARRNLEEAQKYFREESDAYKVSLITNLLTKIDEEEQRDQAEREEVEEDDLAARVMQKTSELYEESEKEKKEFLGFIRRNVETDLGRDYFEVLRRWNSYTPIIGDNYHISKGGGYFLRVGGKGIVIDPGFNFIENFKGAEHAFKEIDAVMITHAHNDHTSDLESILTLLHQYNEAAKGVNDLTSEDTVRADLAQAANKGISEITKDAIENAFVKSPRRKIIDIYWTESTRQKYSGMTSLMSAENYRPHGLEAGEIKEILGIKVKVIRAKHKDLRSDYSAVGFAFKLDDTAVIYTGDTGWDDDIEKAYGELSAWLDREGVKYRLLVAHLGGFVDTERDYLVPGKDKKQAFYDQHLGRLGLVRVNEVLKPDLCFISEFGEELKGSREELTRVYNEVFGGKPWFLPADIRLKLDLKQKKIWAIVSVDRRKKKKSCDWVEPDDVKTTMLLKDYSLHYYAKGRVNVNFLAQILDHEYDQSIR